MLVQLGLLYYVPLAWCLGTMWQGRVQGLGSAWAGAIEAAAALCMQYICGAAGGFVLGQASEAPYAWCHFAFCQAARKGLVAADGIWLARAAFCLRCMQHSWDGCECQHPAGTCMWQPAGRTCYTRYGTGPCLPASHTLLTEESSGS